MSDWLSDAISQQQEANDLINRANPKVLQAVYDSLRKDEPVILTQEQLRPWEGPPA